MPSRGERAAHPAVRDARRIDAAGRRERCGVRLGATAPRPAPPCRRPLAWPTWARLRHDREAPRSSRSSRRPTAPTRPRTRPSSLQPPLALALFRLDTRRSDPVRALASAPVRTRPNARCGAHEAAARLAAGALPAPGRPESGRLDGAKPTVSQLLAENVPCGGHSARSAERRKRRVRRELRWSGREDLNLRPLAPEAPPARAWAGLPRLFRIRMFRMLRTSVRA